MFCVASFTSNPGSVIYRGKYTRFPILMTPMNLSPFRQNFEKNRNRQKYHHSLKEHPTFTKIAKFGCEML